MRFNPTEYWDDRYRSGRDSGAGSRGQAAEHKAIMVNSIVAEHGIRSIIDWGCGDGQVLSLITPDVHYTGVDISQVIIEHVAATHANARRVFVPIDDANDLHADMALSLDVIFHLPDDGDYRRHLEQVFGSARRLVLIHATDHDGGRTSIHCLWRRWTPDIPEGWELTRRPADPSMTGFYLCERR